MSLRDNEIKDDGVMKFMKEIENLSNLNSLSLNLSSNYLTNHCCHSFGQSLSTLLKLATIELDFT